MGRHIRRPKLQLNLPTVEEIILIHDKQIAAASDRSGEGIFPYGPGQIDCMLDRIREYEESGAFSPMVKAAGEMYEFINRGHPFIDGNKRTAIVSVFETCIMNGYIFTSKERKNEVEFSKKVASTTPDELGIEEIFSYFKERIMRIKDFFEPELINARFPCPMCRYPNSIFHPRCLGCGGMKISGVTLTHIGVLRDYDFIYHPVELERIARRNRRYYKVN